MGKGRLEAFSDGVIAILITIMVFDLKPPPGANFSALISMAPATLSYLLSFIYLGIYWNNHHHMLQLVEHINGRILWANLHLLFWLSLVPFSTAWMRTSDFEPIPVAVYGGVLLLSAAAFFVLQASIVSHQKEESPLKEAIGTDWKSKISLGLYIVAFAMAYYFEWVSLTIYAIVALIWLIPDPRFEVKAIELAKKESCD